MITTKTQQQKYNLTQPSGTLFSVLSKHLEFLSIRLSIKYWQENSPSTCVLCLYTYFFPTLIASEIFLGTIQEMPFEIKKDSPYILLNLQCRNRWLTVSDVSLYRKHLRECYPPPHQIVLSRDCLPL